MQFLDLSNNIWSALMVQVGTQPRKRSHLLFLEHARVLGSICFVSGQVTFSLSPVVGRGRGVL